MLFRSRGSEKQGQAERERERETGKEIVCVYPVSAYPCLLRMLWACCSMNRSPGDVPCLGAEGRDGRRPVLGELGGIPATAWSLGGGRAMEEDEEVEVTSM